MLLEKTCALSLAERRLFEKAYGCPLGHVVCYQGVEVERHLRAANALAQAVDASTILLSRQFSRLPKDQQRLVLGHDEPQVGRDRADLPLVVAHRLSRDVRPDAIIANVKHGHAGQHEPVAVRSDWSLIEREEVVGALFSQIFDANDSSQTRA